MPREAHLIRIVRIAAGVRQSTVTQGEQMPDQQTIESVAGKFQQWARELPEGEQAVVAEWMTRGQDVQGYSQGWWQGQGAWAEAWKGSWNW